MIYIEHVAGEMDECTDLQICVFCGELLCDGQSNNVFQILRGYRPGKSIFKTTAGTVNAFGDCFEEGDMTIKCTSLGNGPIRLTEKSRCK